MKSIQKSPAGTYILRLRRGLMHLFGFYSRAAIVSSTTIALQFLSLSSAEVTPHYIGIELQRIEKAIEGRAELI